MWQFWVRKRVRHSYKYERKMIDLTEEEAYLTLARYIKKYQTIEQSNKESEK